MKGEIDVYWFGASQYNAICSEPVPTQSLLDKRVVFVEGDRAENFAAAGFKFCPAITGYYNNCFTFLSPKKVRFKFEPNGDVYTTLNLETDPELVRASHKPSRVYSLAFMPIFIADCDSLVLEQLHPVGCGGEFAEKVSVRQGSYDCAKYARALDLMFQKHDDVNSFTILENDPLMNVRFVTDKKINLIRVFPTPQMHEILQMYTGQITRRHDGKFKTLKHHYDLFKASGARKQLLKLIREQVNAK